MMFLFAFFLNVSVKRTCVCILFFSSPFYKNILTDRYEHKSRSDYMCQGPSSGAQARAVGEAVQEPSVLGVDGVSRLTQILGLLNLSSGRIEPLCALDGSLPQV